MKCEQCQPLLEEYVYGELELEDEFRVDAHVGGCLACARIVATLRQEQDAYAAYQRDVDVTPAVWAAVRARIDQERSRDAASWMSRVRDWLAIQFATPRFSPVLAAALVVIAVAITAGVMSYLRSPDNTNVAETKGATQQTDLRDQDKDTDESTTRTTPIKPDAEAPKRVVRRSVVESDADTLVREAEQKYITAIRILTRDLNARRPGLDADTRASLDNALLDLDRAISATRLAVRQSNGDPVAIGYLMAAYSKKVDFLREVTSD